MQTRRHFLKTSAGLPLIAASGSVNIFVPGAGAASPLTPPNEKIQGARNIALSILKPTQKQIDRGLELHAESLVCESYGFAPVTSIDPAVLGEAFDDGASDDELLDLRHETRVTRCATDAREREEFLQAFRAAGVTCILQNAGEEGNDPLRLLERMARFTFVTDVLRNDVSKAVNADEIVTAKKRASTAFASPPVACRCGSSGKARATN
jgi:membrane dipeptidase